MGAVCNGAAFEVDNDANGDGVLDDSEKALRVMANNIYSALNEDGDI